MCATFPSNYAKIIILLTNKLERHSVDHNKLPDLWPPNSLHLNPIDYKIWVIIQQRVQSTKVQDAKDLMQRLIDAWAGVEESVIQNVIDRRRRHLHTCILPEKDIMNIHCDKS